MTVALLNDPRSVAVAEYDEHERLFPVVTRQRFDIMDVLSAFKLLDPVRVQNGAGSGNCMYRVGRIPDCIGGTIVHLLSPEAAEQLYEGRSISEHGVLHELFTPDALMLMQLAQTNADGGMDWGDSMFAAMGQMLTTNESFSEKSFPKF